MAFNAEFGDRSIGGHVVSERLFSVIDGSELGYYNAFIVGPGKCEVVAGLSGVKGHCTERYRIRSASDLVSKGQSLLRKVYTDYKAGKGLGSQTGGGSSAEGGAGIVAGWSTAGDNSPNDRTTEKGTGSTEFGRLVNEV